MEIVRPKCFRRRNRGLTSHQTDLRLRYPGALAFWAFGRLAELVRSELETALFTSGDFDDDLVFGVFDRLKQVFEIGGGIFAGLLHETGDFRDSHGMLQQHRDEIFPKHVLKLAAGVASVNADFLIKFALFMSDV